MATTFAVQIDFDIDGSFATAGDDITAYVREVPMLSIGSYTPEDRVAAVGTCTIYLDNQTRNFSPAYTGGTYYGKLLPGLPVRIQATDSVTTWTVFRGVTQAWTPKAGLENPTCVLDCADLLFVLQANSVGLPLQENMTADELIKLITAQCWNTGFASGAITIDSDPTGHSVTISGGSKSYPIFNTYAFVASPAAAGDVKVGATTAETAANLADAINKADNSTGYHSLTNRNTIVTPTYSAGSDAVTIIANAHGAWGNSIHIGKSAGSPITLGGTPAGAGVDLAGGADGPSGLNSYADGTQVFDLAGDIWSTEYTNGLTAVTDVTLSEYGFFWAARDGTLTFQNRNWYFSQANAAAAITLLGTHVAQQGSISLDGVYNRVMVSYIPRDTLSTGVIAKANNIISVPGRSGIERWTKVHDRNLSGSIPWAPATDLRPANPGDAVVQLPYIDVATGKVSGAKNVISPVKTTDFTVWDVSDGTGFNYTNAPPIVYSISVAVDGSGVEVSFKNTATGPLYFKDFQVRGDAIVSYDAQNIVYSSQASIAAYGLRTLDYSIPLSTSQAFADGLALWLLAHHKDPVYRVQTVTFSNQDVVNGVNVYSLNIGDVVSLTEDQTGVSAAKHLIMGITGNIGNGGLSHSLTFLLLSFDGKAYFTLDDATLGQLDGTGVLAL